MNAVGLKSQLFRTLIESSVTLNALSVPQKPSDHEKQESLRIDLPEDSAAMGEIFAALARMFDPEADDKPPLNSKNFTDTAALADKYDLETPLIYIWFHWCRRTENADINWLTLLLGLAFKNAKICREGCGKLTCRAPDSWDRSVAQRFGFQAYWALVNGWYRTSNKVWREVSENIDWDEIFHAA